MSIASNLANLANEVNSQGVLSAAKVAISSGGPKITSIVVTDSSYVTLDDTAVNITGGYIKIIGSGFASGCQVLINNTAATSVTFISATEVRAQVPATLAGTYIVYVVNSDGGVAIRVNGVTFSATPTWNTVSPISGVVDTAISLQLDATSATTYALAAGSSLPSGVTLSSGGLLSGTVTGITSETTYNFTVVATDAELQDSPKAFAFNVSAGDLYFKYNTLLLSANGSNNANNNTFLDSSTNNFTITRVGNTTQGTVSPYYNASTWANYFNGADSYLTATYSTSSFDWWTSDYTIEAWVYASSWATWGSGTAYGQSGLVGNYTTADATNYWSFGPHTDGTIKFYYWNGAQNTVSSSQTLKLNQWNHIAFTKTSSGIKLWVNGVGNTVTAVSGTPLSSNSTPLTIGRSNTSNVINGGVSNLRIVKGTAVYTANFTPPTQSLTAITNTQLLTCNSNTIVDNSANALTITKNNAVGTGRPISGLFSSTFPYYASTYGGSAYFDASTSYLSVPNNALLQLGSSNFTIEFWTYLNGTGGELLSLQASGNLSYMIDVYTNNATLYGTSNNSSWDISSGLTFGTVPSNAWSHIAVSRSGNSIYCFVNGVLGRTITSSASFYASTAALTIGNDRGTGIASGGYISNLRIVKGTAVYTAAFTPPTAPVTAITNTSLLCNFTNAGIVDATMQNNLLTVADAKISTTQSKFGGSSMFFDGTGDYLSVADNVNLELGSGDFTLEGWFYGTSAGSTDNIIVAKCSAAYAPYWVSFYGGNSIKFCASSTNSSWDVANNVSFGAPTLNTWNHFAVSRSGSSIRLFLNGVLGATVTTSASLTDHASPFTVGSQFNGANPFTGYIDDLRITKGYARYTANFTPPGAAAPQ
jgi:hypothetical protein